MAAAPARNSQPAKSPIMWEQINFTSAEKGVSTCPACSDSRKNKKQKCLSWDRQTGIANCHHCGTRIFKDSHTDWKSTVLPSPPPEPPIYAPELLGNEPEAHNGLFNTLAQRYGEEATREAFTRYRVRTNGELVYFHQSDRRGIRYIKQVKYQPNGHRCKESGAIRSLTPKSEGNYKQCLFGLHLHQQKQFAHIVESEKTALVCYLEMPDRVWLATGGANHIELTRDCQKAILHPDTDKAEEWREWAERNQYKIDLTILELELGPKADLADAILG